ncbi:MAG: DUF4783 domain-containing protein [Bacteroidota bacterium]
MKTLIVSLLFLPTLSGPVVSGGMDDIAGALRQGDVNTLSSFFDAQVDLSIMDQEDTYSKSEATSMVRDFFRTNAPSGFSQVHSGTSAGDEAEYCIGDLSTSGGSYRVYIYLANSGGQQLIQELRFDAE